MSEDVFRGLGVRITLPAPEDFSRIRETLTRMGIASSREKALYQSAHILHKRGEYAIVSFKEMFEMDGRESDINDEDRARRNRIAFLLEEWGLAKIIDPEKYRDHLAPMSALKVLSFAEKAQWSLRAKHPIGSRHAEY